MPNNINSASEPKPVNTADCGLQSLPVGIVATKLPIAAESGAHL